MRTTKNVRGGKERHIRVNEAKLEELTTSKMQVDESAQPAKCLLITSKLTIDNKQNDLIKDNINNISEKDNICVLLPNGNKTGEAAAVAAAANSEPVEIEGMRAKVMTSKEALNKYGLSACANRIAAGSENCFWIDGELVKLT